MKNIGIFYRDSLSCGGMPREIQLMSFSLIKYLNSVTVYCYGSNNYLPYVKGGVNFYQYKKPTNPLSINKYLASALSGNNDLDCMFIVGGHIPSNYAVAKHCVYNKIPYIFSPCQAYNSYLFKTRNTFLKIIYKQMVEKFVLRNADKVRAYSEHNRQEIVKYGYCKEVFILEEGVDFELMESANEITDDVYRTGKINITYFGRMDYIGKGIDTLINSFEKHELSEKAHLHLIGPMDLGYNKNGRVNRLEKCAENITFHGKMNGQKLFNHIKNSDMVICLSRHEGIPRSLRESLYLGVPIIVTKETNVGDRVREYQAGYVVERAPESIAECIKKYERTCEFEKNRMRQNAKKLSREVYDWDVIASKFVKYCLRLSE